MRLEVEHGPVAEVRSSGPPTTTRRTWPGISRLFGGIHVPADDLAGRIVGSQCGKIAWQLAQTYFAGTARA